jgi:hypothetical protein
MPPSGNALALEQVPKKLTGYFDKNMLQLFDFERVLTDQMIPFDRVALYVFSPGICWSGLRMNLSG